MLPDLRDALITAARRVSERGWTPATSGNLSVRAPEGFWVSASGLDKGQLTRDDLLPVDAEGRPSGPRRPSAETLLHAAIYQRFPAATTILHVHSPSATVLSRVTPGDRLVLEGYEIAKAFTGVDTHERPVFVPLVENSQDVATIARAVAPLLDQPDCAPGYLIRGHGLYTWGAGVDEAMRHLEAFDFLFSCEIEHRRVRA